MSIFKPFLWALAGALAIGPVAAQAQEAPVEATAPVSATPPAALELYGQLPAFSSPRLSPDGTKLAHLVSTGTSQALLVMDLSTVSVIGGLREIENKVRRIDWVGNDYILITTSTTASLPFSIGKGEYTQGLIYSLADRSVQTVFARNQNLARIMIGGAIIRQTPDGPAVFSQAFDASDGTADLYRVDPATNRATKVTGGQNAIDYLLDSAGEPVARARYFFWHFVPALFS